MNRIITDTMLFEDCMDIWLFSSFLTEQIDAGIKDECRKFYEVSCFQYMDYDEYEIKTSKPHLIDIQDLTVDEVCNADTNNTFDEFFTVYKAKVYQDKTHIEIFYLGNWIRELLM